MTMNETNTPNPIETHPVQVADKRYGQKRCVTSKVTLAAYEVYTHIYGTQNAIVTGDCRGGFSAGELIAYLYAKNFPKEQWKARVQEASAGMEGL